MQNYNVLIIDRDDANRSLISDLIGVRYKNIRVLSSRKIEKAADFIKKEHIDLALVEIAIFTGQSQDYFQIHETIASALKGIPVVTMASKAHVEKIGKDLVIQAIDNLNKPFKPATLYFILDKYLAGNQDDSMNEDEFFVPDWAKFKHIDVRILCQTYSCEKEKAVKILKLYPSHVQSQLENINTLFKDKNGDQLHESFLALRTSFLYFSKPEVLEIFDSIVEHIANVDLEAGYSGFMALKKNWELMSGEIEKI